MQLELPRSLFVFEVNLSVHGCLSVSALVQGDGARTSITLDFGDGHALTYSNVSSIEDGIKHIYKVVGIYRVTATGENSLGSETTTLFLHVTCELLRTFVRFVYPDLREQLFR